MLALQGFSPFLACCEGRGRHDLYAVQFFGPLGRGVGGYGCLGGFVALDFGPAMARFSVFSMGGFVARGSRKTLSLLRASGRVGGGVSTRLLFFVIRGPNQKEV